MTKKQPRQARSSTPQRGRSHPNPPLDPAAEMAAARALEEIRRRCDPISTKELAQQEHLTEHVTQRRIALASLPGQVQTLVEQQRLSVASAECVAAAKKLQPHEKTAVAEKIVAAGSPTRDTVRGWIRSVQAWSPATLTTFLSTPSMGFDEAQEMFRQEERARREKDRRAEERRRAERIPSTAFHAVALKSVNHFNQVTAAIIESPGGVRPNMLGDTVDALLDAVGNGAGALAALGAEQQARDRLRAVLADLSPGYQVMGGTVGDDMVNGDVVVGDIDVIEVIDDGSQTGEGDAAPDEDHGPAGHPWS